MRPYCRAGVCSRRIITRDTAGLSTYGLVHRNNSTAGINCVRPQPSPSAIAATSPEGRGFKVRLTSKQKRLIFLLYTSRKTNLDINILP